MRTLSACQTVLMGWWVRAAEHLASLHGITMDEAGKQVDWWPVPMELLLDSGLLCPGRPLVYVCSAACGVCQSLIMWLLWAGPCGGRCRVIRRLHRNLWLFSGRDPLRTQHPVYSPSPPCPTHSLWFWGMEHRLPALSDSKDSRQGRRMCTEDFIASKTVLRAEA